jgi:hypothetical protein
MFIERREFILQPDINLQVSDTYYYMIITLNTCRSEVCQAYNFIKSFKDL